jgi:hypothetical protein
MCGEQSQTFCTSGRTTLVVLHRAFTGERPETYLGMRFEHTDNQFRSRGEELVDLPDLPADAPALPRDTHTEAADVCSACILVLVGIHCGSRGHWKHARCTRRAEAMSRGALDSTSRSLGQTDRHVDETAAALASSSSAKVLATMQTGACVAIQ